MFSQLDSNVSGNEFNEMIFLITLQRNLGVEGECNKRRKSRDSKRQ